jgi:hypothetical protein
MQEYFNITKNVFNLNINTLIIDFAFLFFGIFLLLFVKWTKNNKNIYLFLGVILVIFGIFSFYFLIFLNI